MTATDVLRALLDERGVEYYRHEEDEPLRELKEGTDRATSWRLGKASCTVVECESGTLDVWIDHATPAQAIEATLGHGTCHNASNVTDKHGQARFVCSACGAWLDSRMLWNPEYPNGESPFVKDCRLNFCPNCGRKVVGA